MTARPPMTDEQKEACYVALDNISTAHRPPKWIPVTQRLPEVGATVLGWDRDGHYTLHVYCGQNKSGVDVWFGCNVAGGEYEDGRMGGPPDFWTPLPSPPPGCDTSTRNEGDA